jgi:hypothetical protein
MSANQHAGKPEPAAILDVVRPNRWLHPKGRHIERSVNAVPTSPPDKVRLNRARIVLATTLLLSGCWTDTATRLAYDLESAATRVGSAEGATYTLVHRVPSKNGECAGPYRVQFDKVGAIIVWCKDLGANTTVSSHSTSYHARFVDTPETYILDKRAKEPLLLELERRGGRVRLLSVR